MSEPTEMKLKVHEIARVFPAVRGPERAAMKASIKAVGVCDPVLTWQSGKSTWVIDGRNRFELLEELLAEGVTHADNGTPLTLKVSNFTGTELEAMDESLRRNRDRRHLTSSQKAAISVLAGDLHTRYELKTKGWKTDSKEAQEYLAEKSKGDVAARVAEEAGTNRAYLFYCLEFAKEAPKILEMVAEGTINIPEGKKALARHKLGLPLFPEAGEAEGGEEAPEAPPEGEGSVPQPEVVVLDGLKNPVGPAWQGIFVARERVTEILAQLKHIKADLVKYTELEGGENCPKDELIADLNNMIRTIRGSQPHVRCPHCSGTGKSGESTKKKCPECKGRKFLDAVQWKLVPEALKATVLGTETPATEEAPELEEAAAG